MKSDGRVLNVLALSDFQAMFGHSSSLFMFNMFKSESNPNLLFKDSTKCLQEVSAGKNYTEFLGKEYITTMDSLRQCASSKTGMKCLKSVLTIYRWNNMNHRTADSLYYYNPNGQIYSFLFVPSQNWRRPAPSTPV